MEFENKEIAVPKFYGFEYLGIGIPNIDYEIFYVPLKYFMYPNKRGRYIPTPASHGMMGDICFKYKQIKPTPIDTELLNAIEDFPKGTYAKLLWKNILVEIEEEAIRETSETSTKEVHIKTSCGYQRPCELLAIEEIAYKLKRPRI